MALASGNNADYDCGFNSNIYSCNNIMVARLDAQWNHFVFYYVERING